MLAQPVNEKDHYQGNINSPIILVEYGDYESSYCGEAYFIVKQIQQKFGENICFIYRHYVSGETHPYALHAAYAAEAAAVQNKFWEMHDTLYEHQSHLEDEDLIAYAKLIGLESQQFMQDFESLEITNKLEDEFMIGTESGVEGTPTFFINNHRHEGSYLYTDLEAAIIKVRST